MKKKKSNTERSVHFKLVLLMSNKFCLPESNHYEYKISVLKTKTVPKGGLSRKIFILHSIDAYSYFLYQFMHLGFLNGIRIIK